MSIGDVFKPETDSIHKEQAYEKKYGYVKVPTADDNTESYAQFVITSMEEPINLTEYCTRMANHYSTHVLQIDDCDRVREIHEWR